MFGPYEVERFEGLSPRTRGSRRAACRGGCETGPIPADAGEPMGNGPSETGDGAYPRGRGGAWHSLTMFESFRGLSPRTRGSRFSGPCKACVRRPIPADAGEPLLRDRPREGEGAYPRGRGGAGAGDDEDDYDKGLSPRTRGSLIDDVAVFTGSGPIPADAGEPRRARCRRPPDRAYPRGRGGARTGGARPTAQWGLSPRTRGSRRAGDAGDDRAGPIPADAGEPCGIRWAAATCRAYPRGRGGALLLRSPAVCVRGLSPRTRGSQPSLSCQIDTLGPIPADAGEPAKPRSFSAASRAYPRGRGGAPYFRASPAME